MSNVSVPIYVINEAQRKDYLDTPYNPPTGNFDKAAFSAEFEGAQDAVRAAMAEHWLPWPCDRPGVTVESEMARASSETPRPETNGEADFFINPDLWFFARSFHIEVGTERVLTSKVLDVVHRAVLGITPDYTVGVFSAFPGLRTKDGNLYPMFEIFVEKTRILVYSESPETLKKLGITGPKVKKLPPCSPNR